MSIFSFPLFSFAKLVAKQLGKYARIYLIFAILHIYIYIYILMIYDLMMLENIFVHMFK